MTLKGETVTKINAEYTAYTFTPSSKKLQLNVGSDGYWSDSIYSDNWQVCKLEDLSTMIEELKALRKAIENITGVML